MRSPGEKITADGLRRGLVARVEARVLPKAGGRSLRQHRDAITRAVAAVAPRTAEQRHMRACEDRHVEFRSDVDAMAWLNVYGPADDIAATKAMVDATADVAKTADPGEARTVDQLRGDVLARLAWMSPLPLSSLIGIGGCSRTRPPVPCSTTARPGTPAPGPARSRHRPRPQLPVQHLLPTRSGAAKPTTTPAGTRGWSTSASNLGMLCASCHNGKTHAGWQLDQPEPGHFTWRAPTGPRYDLEPPF